MAIKEEITRVKQQVHGTHNLIQEGIKWKPENFIHKPAYWTKIQYLRTRQLPQIDLDERTAINKIQDQFQIYKKANKQIKENYQNTIEEKFNFLIEKLKFDSKWLADIILSYNQNHVLISPFTPINNYEDLENFIKILYWIEQDIRLSLGNTQLLIDVIFSGLGILSNRKTPEEIKTILDLITETDQKIKKVLADYDEAAPFLKNYIKEKENCFNPNAKKSANGLSKQNSPDASETKTDPKFAARQRLSDKLKEISQSNIPSSSSDKQIFTDPTEINANTQQEEQLLQFVCEFGKVLRIVESECEELSIKARNNKRYTPATEKALQLYETLEKNFQSFLEKDINAKEFYTKCDRAIEKAAPTLKNHGCWPELLRTIAFLALSIMTAGFANIVSKCATGSFRFFAADKTELKAETLARVNDHWKQLESSANSIS